MPGERHEPDTEVVRLLDRAVARTVPPPWEPDLDAVVSRGLARRRRVQVGLAGIGAAVAAVVVGVTATVGGPLVDSATEPQVADEVGVDEVPAPSPVDDVDDAGCDPSASTPVAAEALVQRLQETLAAEDVDVDPGTVEVTRSVSGSTPGCPRAYRLSVPTSAGEVIVAVSSAVDLLEGVDCTAPACEERRTEFYEVRELRDDSAGTTVVVHYPESGLASADTPAVAASATTVVLDAAALERIADAGWHSTLDLQENGLVPQCPALANDIGPVEADPLTGGLSRRLAALGLDRGVSVPVPPRSSDGPLDCVPVYGARRELPDGTAVTVDVVPSAEALARTAEGVCEEDDACRERIAGDHLVWEWQEADGSPTVYGRPQPVEGPLADRVVVVRASGPSAPEVQLLTGVLTGEDWFALVEQRYADETGDPPLGVP